MIILEQRRSVKNKKTDDKTLKLVENLFKKSADTNKTETKKLKLKTETKKVIKSLKKLLKKKPIKYLKRSSKKKFLKTQIQMNHDQNIQLKYSEESSSIRTRNNRQSRFYKVTL